MSSVLAQYDVDTENVEDIIVDADVIEAVKENIQPLQKGRRVTALSAIFSTPHAQRDVILSRKRAQFRLQVSQALNDENENDDDGETTDPLDVYSRFIAWTLESYPQGQSAESGLMELLEEATRSLKDRANCKQNPRYLKLWTLYAGYVDKPAMIYAYLLANEIGTDLAQLYEDYARVLERDGRRREADEIYLLGIARRVEPLDHLKKRHTEFQRRMLANPLPTPPSPPRTNGPGLPPPIVGHRIVLEDTRSKRSHKPVAPPAPDVFMAPPCQPNGRLQIFIDPTGEEAESSTGNEWLDFGTRVSRTKENRPEVHKMTAGPLPKSRSTQRSVSGPASGIRAGRDPTTRGAFVPFRDEGEGDSGTATSLQSPRVASASSLALDLKEETMRPPTTPWRPSFVPFADEASIATPVRQSILETPTSLAPRANIGGALTEAEALRRDPFKNYVIRPTDA